MTPTTTVHKAYVSQQERRIPPRAPTTRTINIDPFRVLRQNILWIIASGFLGTIVGGMAWVALDMFYPMYSGEVLFEIHPGLSDAEDLATTNNLNDDLVFRLASTETVLLTNRPVLLAAMDDPEILQTKWHEYFIIRGTFSPEDAVDDLEEDIWAGAQRNTNLFLLRWSAHEASDVPIVLNAIKNQYMRLRKEQDERVFIDNQDLFKGQLSDTNRLLEDLNDDIRNFLVEKGITTLDDPRYSQVALAMEELLEQNATAKTQLSFSRSSLDQVGSKLTGTIEPTAEDRQEAEQDLAMQTHMQALLNFRTELRMLREKYNSDHTAVLNMESRIRAGEQEREATLQEIMQRNLKAQLKQLNNGIDQLTRTITELEKELENKDIRLRELAADQSEYQAKESQRRMLEAQRDANLQIMNEVKLMRLRKDAARVRMVQDAQTPREKSFPKPEMIIPLGTFSIVALVIGGIFLRELTDQRVKGASDLQIIPGAQVLGVIPDLDDDPTKCDGVDMVVRRSPHSVLAESYRQLTTPITRAMDRAGHQTLLVVGGLPGTGSTTIVTNLAAVAAGMGKKVLVVDANFRRPRLAEALNVAADHPGLGDLLNDSTTLDDSIVDAGYGVDLIGAGTAANRIFERLSDRRFDSIIAQVRDRYDMVLFDAPPAVVAGDAIVLAHRVDAAVLVVRAHQEQRGLVARMMNLINDTRCELLGIVLNRPRGTAGGYFKKNYETMAKYAPVTDAGN